MISFLVAIVVLIVGYFVYGRVVEKIFGIDKNRPTPAVVLQDDVDYVPMPLWRVFLVQFLNIAGLGPIFGAIAGAMYGPSAFLWIVLGSIFAGGVHDYFSGMLSIRHNGLSIGELVGIYLGNNAKQFVRVFSIVLLIFVGTVFLVGPAKIIHGMAGNFWNVGVWVGIIVVYYILSTVLPVNKIIGKLYPLFGIAMLCMAIGLFIALIFGGYGIPEVTWDNLSNMTTNPKETPLFPMLFVTIACGAISGFHATQSPLMARCITSEKSGKKVFFGAMITEGIVALIWAAASMVFFGGVEGLNSAMAENGNNAAWAANEISLDMLGPLGGILALLGIVAAPITSGDTAFRSARLIIADMFGLEQHSLKKRFWISIPLFMVAFILTRIDFSIIWRYFAWSNQTLAMIVLWTITAYLIDERKNFWIALIPAVFMTMVCATYILVAPEGFGMETNLSYLLGFIITIIVSMMFRYFVTKKRKLKHAYE